ncbi:VanZ family protein [Bacillus sp. AGMB 02131]|uniref:VanZ family protein n=1 Tax=Peribacillus faecalis TaxID=2772559 RepID=A0A927CX29_9BACI|nr:VanZ family protein [Peribacillus faecalis]MBD3109228.1 VanZ family protein [Peribacillus faecalis]
MKIRQQILLNILLYSVFAFYLVILFGLLFMKAHSFSSINIVPFHSIGSYLFSDNKLLRAFAFSNVVGNIVLFVPLGVYLPLFIQEKSILKNISWIILISTLVEILQFVFKVGASDIDDVILNGLGGFIGIIAYRILLKKFVVFSKVKFAVTLIAPIAAILSVLGLVIYNA